MKEFIDKLIERLEEAHESYVDEYGMIEIQTQEVFVKMRKIVNQLADEFAPDINVGTKVSEMPTGWVIDGKGIHKQTNADRIRSMTDEELARLFDSDLGSITINFHCEECNNRLNCDVCYLEWLQSEAE